MWNSKLPVALVAALLAACANEAGRGGDGAASNRATTVEAAPEDLVFFDSEVFDLQLSRSLRSTHPVITVKPSDKMTINTIPPRLNAWLVAVQRRGGNVNLVAVRKSKDGKQEEFLQVLLPIALDLIAKFVANRMNSGAASNSDMTRDVINYVRRDPMFLGVDNVLVTIRYDDASKEIETISFRKLEHS